ncbi:hypothetical protein [Streptomyces sp. NBRC 110028]|uniref:hypothetical protein n=1 Tax=Streptomyces sp. NBRC 110028 TaxID=1621260 RepID=UPI0006E41EE2|nr:hypothetical protein [Streptomyces sp. NBRC 110028]
MEASPHPVRTRRRPGRRIAPVLAVASVLLAAGCGGGSGSADANTGGRTDGKGETARPGGDASPSAEPARVEQLAKYVGCKPEFTTKVDDYRQAICHNSKGKFLFLDFISMKAQSDWLETAQMYGGVYLVGNRWALSSSPKKNMETLRGEFGGTIEENGAFGSSPGAASSPGAG